MGMWANLLVADEGLNYLSSNVNKICFCTTRPATKAAATGVANGTNTMCGITTDIGWTAANSTNTAGMRKLTLGQASDVTISTSGGIGHIALITATTLAYVTTVATTRNVTTSDTATMQAWRIDILDPTSD